MSSFPFFAAAADIVDVVDNDVAGVLTVFLFVFRLCLGFLLFLYNFIR